jgi:hypothetical protein
MKYQKRRCWVKSRETRVLMKPVVYFQAFNKTASRKGVLEPVMRFGGEVFGRGAHD